MAKGKTVRRPNSHSSKKGVTMYTVKKLKKGTVLERSDVGVGRVKAVGTKVGSDCYAVVDGAGKVVKTADGQFEIYARKATAQQVAGWYNKAV